MVESMRRSEKSLGFFVRPLPGGSLTGLITGSEIPTGAFTDAVGYNARDMIVLREARTRAAAVDAAIINDSQQTGQYLLYQVLTAADGKTAIKQYELTLTGRRVQDVSACVSLPADAAGEYRLQLLLASEAAGVLAASRVMPLSLHSQTTASPMRPKGAVGPK